MRPLLLSASSGVLLLDVPHRRQSGGGSDTGPKRRELRGEVRLPRQRWHDEQDDVLRLRRRPEGDDLALVGANPASRSGELERGGPRLRLGGRGRAEEDGEREKPAQDHVLRASAPPRPHWSACMIESTARQCTPSSSAVAIGVAFGSMGLVVTIASWNAVRGSAGSSRFGFAVTSG